MAVDLHALLVSVDDEASFIAFVDALHADFVAERELEATGPSSPNKSGSIGWENGTVDAFLDAAASWGSATLESGKGRLCLPTLGIAARTSCSLESSTSSVLRPRPR